MIFQFAAKADLLLILLPWSTFASEISGGGRKEEEGEVHMGGGGEKDVLGRVGKGGGEEEEGGG